MVPCFLLLRRWGWALGGCSVRDDCGLALLSVGPRYIAAAPLAGPGPQKTFPWGKVPPKGADEGNGKRIDHVGPRKTKFCGAVRRSFVRTSRPHKALLCGAPGFFGRARGPAPTDRARRGRRAPREGLAPPGERPPKATPNAAGERTKHDLPARRTTRRPPDRTTAYPCSTMGGRNGRGWSSHRA